ncbi:MAG: class I tRNA ligase family protein, partial [bacterium]|nr:class I tRNA ligase family protein [bacterium]
MAQQPWPEREEEILALWDRERVFEQSVARDAAKGEFVFYDGPPTANAPPGMHHAEPQTYKDVIPRYKTMRGYRVRRKAGWDTHGLPVELQIEKKLGLKTKKDVEAYGIAPFNAACRDSVWEFKGDWERLKHRMGSWMDMRNPYVTYEMPFIESVWWFLKQAWEKGLLSRDYRSVWYCPRCQTPLSSHEVALGYKDDVEDPSVFIKFQILNSKFQIPGNAPAHFLAWTTTPWTLPGNVALAVHPEVEYAVVRHHGDHLILARPLVERVLGADAEIVQTVQGRDLVGTRYEPLYRLPISPLPAGGGARGGGDDSKKTHTVLPADFVSLEDGTGIVHIAPAYGGEDFELGKAHGIPPLFTVQQNGTVMEGFPGAGKFFKSADADVRADLTARGLLFRDEKIRHTYPFCWRCDTPLLAYARSSWYITMSKLRAEIQAKNQTIHWLPEHIKDGRFGEWLRELKDWAITRERYWGAPIPIWECDRCQHREILGSFAELIAKAPKRNHFILMRHGEAESNARCVISSKLATSDQYPLTDAGRKRVTKAAESLKEVGITKIIASPFHRMRQTAEIVSAAVGVSVTYDERLR